MMRPQIHANVMHSAIEEIHPMIRRQEPTYPATHPHHNILAYHASNVMRLRVRTEVKWAIEERTVDIQDQIYTGARIAVLLSVIRCMVWELP